MDTSSHEMSSLFQQLGLPHADTDIEAFIHRHKGIPADVPLVESGIWTPAQAGFLQEALEDDSDWVEIVDQLDARLRT